MKTALKNQGIEIGLYRVASLMKEAGIVAVSPKKRHSYPSSGEQHPKAPNLLQRKFNPGTCHTHWVGDITYIKTHAGWSYLACVLDLGSREIVGWAISKTPDAKLTKAALKYAVQKHNCWVSEDNIPEKSYPLFRAWGIMEQLVTDLQQGQKR